MKDLVTGITWRSREGEIPIKKMETRHLYFTIVMIWNHCCPENLRIEPFSPYRFSPKYSPDYIVPVLTAMFIEVSRRRNLTEQWRHNLQYIQAKSKELASLNQKQIEGESE